MLDLQKRTVECLRLHFNREGRRKEFFVLHLVLPMLLDTYFRSAVVLMNNKISSDRNTIRFLDAFPLMLMFSQNIPSVVFSLTTVLIVYHPMFAVRMTERGQ
jgi:hypothetical protein